MTEALWTEPREVAWLEIKLEGYWHAGTGQGGGPGLDARVALSGGGLPVFSGRALKGLLREAARTAVAVGRFDAALVGEWFGTDLREHAAGGGRGEADAARFQEEGRFTTGEGQLTVDDAVIGRGDEAQAWERWARANPRDVALLRSEFASTKIEGDTIAAEQTLRVTEVAVPVTLHARLLGPRAALDAVGEIAHMVRHLGANRTRGLGRASVKLVREGR